jgi:hypothetical protein
MGFVVLLLIMGLTLPLFASDDFWPSYPVSKDNAAFLVSEILSEADKLLSPKIESCSNSKLDQLCSKDRMDQLQNFDKNQKRILDSFIDELKQSKKIKSFKPFCEKHVDGIQPHLKKAQEWIKRILDLKTTDQKILKDELMKDLDSKVVSAEEKSKFEKKWKDYCRGVLVPEVQSYSEIYFSNMVKNFEYSGKGLDFCKEIKSRDFIWIRDYMINSSSAFLKDQLEKLTKYPDFLKSHLQENIVDMSLSEKRSIFVKDSLDHDGLYDLRKNILNEDCEKYSRGETVKDQICDCVKKKLQTEINEQIEEKYKEKVAKVQGKLDQMYQDMVEKSVLTPSEKKELLLNYPASKINFNLFEGALTRATYNPKSMSPPFTSVINLSPAMIDELTKDSPSELGEMNFSVISHELGHHFFTSLIGKNNMFEKLSDKTKEKIQKLSNCLDNTTIEREMLPAFKGEIEAIPKNLSSLIPEKRAELGADLFASTYNGMKDASLHWKKESGAMINCLMVESLKTPDQNRFYLLDSHTSPEARVDILLNPPSCGEIVWKKE